MIDQTPLTQTYSIPKSKLHQTSGASSMFSFSKHSKCFLVYKGIWPKYSAAETFEGNIIRISHKYSLSQTITKKIE